MFRWFAPKPLPTTCNVDFTLDDERQSLCGLLKRLRPILEMQNKGRWNADLSRCQFVGPYAATVLLATWLRAKKLDQRAQILFQKDNPQLSHFLNYSGFNSWINGTEHASLSPVYQTAPLSVLTSARFDAPSPIVSLVKSHITLGEEQEEQLKTCIVEVIQNMEDHAASAIGAVMCGRWVQLKNRVRVAIVDMGDGIHTTLARKFPDTTNAEVALSRVIRGNYSAKSRPNNMGVGISNLWSIVTQCMNGQIFIVTEDGVAYNKGNQVHSENLGFRFPGTGVFFSVPVSDSRMVEAAA